MYPNCKGRKTHKAHRELDGVQHLPVSAIKAWEGPSTVHLCAGGGKVSPVLQGSAIQMFISTPNATKTGKRDSLFFVDLKKNRKDTSETKWVRAAIKQD